jgi:hypothetical protein
MNSRCLSAGSIRFLGHPFPAGDSRPLRFAYCVTTDSIGLTTFRANEIQPGWVSLILRDHGVRDSSLYDSCPLVRCVESHLTLDPSCRLYQPPSDSLTSRSLIRDSLSFTRPVFPLPVATPCDLVRPWAFPPRFTPRRYQRRMGKWEQALDTSLSLAFHLDHSL